MSKGLIDMLVTLVERRLTDRQAIITQLAVHYILRYATLSLVFRTVI